MEVDWKTAVTAPGYEIRPWSLRFANEDIERRFIAERLERSLTGIRLFLSVGAMLYCLFGFLDYLVLGEDTTTAWIIRYGALTPVLLIVFGLTYTPIFKRIAEFALGFAMFSAGFGIIAMTALVGPPGNALYYAGLIMVSSYCLNLIRLRWTTAAGIAILLALLYQPVVLWINPIPSELVVSNNFFLIMGTGVGIFACYVTELYMRRDYLHAEMLKVEKDLSDMLLAKAESASRAKSDFLSIMSHELRTPLNAILGFSDIMRQGMFGPIGSEKYLDYVNDIHGAATHLMKIVTDVLDLSKAENGRLTIQPEVLNVAEVLATCMRLLRDQAGQQGVRLSLQMPPGPHLVEADPQLIRQAFINLLSNAVKFTPNGGSVSVTLTRDPRRGMVISFADTGIGIAEHNLEKVLEPFVQVESAFARSHGGAGIGLALVKHIAELHDGAVKLESTLGAGTTVHLILPPSRCRDAAAPDRQLQQA
ncbi:MAG TPA: HAMP domain-containing sensor histidine kinase [Sphingomonadales bacterium]